MVEAKIYERKMFTCTEIIPFCAPWKHLKF